MTAKKCTKKRDARAKLLFYRSKPVAFLPFSLTSPSSLLKLPHSTLLRVHQRDPIKMTGKAQVTDSPKGAICSICIVNTWGDCADASSVFQSSLASSTASKSQPGSGSGLPFCLLEK